MNDTQTQSPRLRSLVTYLLLAVVGSVAFYVVFEWMDADGRISAGIYLVILTAYAVVEIVQGGRQSDRR